MSNLSYRAQLLKNGVFAVYLGFVMLIAIFMGILGVVGSSDEKAEPLTGLYLAVMTLFTFIAPVIIIRYLKNRHKRTVV